VDWKEESDTGGFSNGHIVLEDTSRRRHLLLMLSRLSAARRLPMVSFTGSLRNSAASFLTAAGHVAENITICRSGRRRWRILRVSTSKPTSRQEGPKLRQRELHLMGEKKNYRKRNCILKWSQIQQKCGKTGENKENESEIEYPHRGSSRVRAYGGPSSRACGRPRPERRTRPGRRVVWGT